MPVKFNASKPKLDATIELTSITEEAYRDIVEFINARTGEQKPMTAGFAAGATASLTSETKEEVKEGKPPKRYQEKDPEMSEKLDLYFKEAANNDDDFEKIIMGSHDFASYLPEYSGCSAHLIGKKFSKYCQPAKPISGKTPNGRPTTVNRWYVPIRKKKNYTLGDAIRKGREENGLSLKELAELIEYPPDVVKKWESGEYVPSCDGLSAMKLALGASYFENIH